MNYNVAFYGKWIRLAKKSSETDVLLASHSSSEDTFSFAAPALYPEKIHSLVMPAMMSDIVVVHYTQELQGVALGETLVLLDLLRKPGFFVIAENTDTELLDRFVKTTFLASWDRVPDNEIAIKEKIKTFAIPEKIGPAKILVDASFEVRSVGTVILGRVLQGSLKIHDKLTAYPSKAQATIKSIQKQDKNFRDAQFNDRVGLALKGVSVSDVPRGTVLSAEPIECAKEFNANVSLFPLVKQLPHDSHLCLGLQWGKVHVDGNKITSEKSWALEGTGILCHNTKPGSLRVLGRLSF